MSPCHDDAGFEDLARRLREERVVATARELDDLKLRVLARERRRSSTTKGRARMRSRVLVAFLTVGLLAGSAGGVIAGSGGGNGSNDAANAQYKPGYGPCKNGGVDGSGATHTGPPGQPGQSCATKTNP